MGDDDNYPWGHGVSSFTRLLRNVEYDEETHMPNFTSYDASGSYLVGDPNPIQSMGATTSHQEGGDDVINDNIHVDEFGIDHEDDMDQSSEDGDVNEVDVATAHMAREAATITPSWNITGEPNPQMMDSWQTWNARNPFPVEGEFAPGQHFNSLQELKRKISIYSASKGKEYKVEKARDRWYTVVCMEKDRGCTWRLSAHKITEHLDMWAISTYKGPHVPSCVRDVMHMDNRNINEKFISEETVSLIRVDKALKPKAIMQVIQDVYSVRITYKRAWGAKQNAIASIFGDWDESYAQLPRLMFALEQCNHGTVVEWCTTTSVDGIEQVFQRVFWSFGPCIAGFQHCRPLITIDGTHMYGKYKGTMLIAMDVDANQQIFPLAFAIVESENGSSWPWFMELIGRRVTQRTGLCIISDRHAGIMKAMRELPRWKEPNAFHRLCVRHVVSNFNSRFKDKHLKRLVGSTAYKHEEAQFVSGFEAIGKKNLEAHAYMEHIGKDKWSLSHDGGFRYRVMTSNMSECFNGVMKGARSLPIAGLVQSTFYKLNAYFVERRGMVYARSVTGHQYSKKVELKLEENLQIARRAEVITFNVSRHVYEVHVPPIQEYGNRLQYVVNLSEGTCNCQRWKNLKVPCPHVLAVCRAKSFSYDAYVDRFYTTKTHLMTYQMPFYPIGDKVDWPVIEGLPLIPDPTKLRDVGRPGRRRTTRYRNEMDFSIPGKNYCSVCGQEGHNKRSCASRPGTSGQ